LDSHIYCTCSSCKCFKFRPPGNFGVIRGQFTLRWESFVAFAISCTDTKKCVQYNEWVKSRYTPDAIRYTIYCIPTYGPLCIIHIHGNLTPCYLSTKIEDWSYMTDHGIYLVHRCRLRILKFDSLIVWNLKAIGSIPNVTIFV